MAPVTTALSAAIVCLEAVPSKVVDVTDQSFPVDVIERSKTTPVVVDLWAPWCQPCRTLGPLLEKLVGATEGKVVLAKVNIDENPGIAQAFQVQSIPAVFAMADGKVVDQFMGALPESEVQAFVDRLLPEGSPVEQLVAAGDETSLRQALELEPANEKAIVALAELCVGEGRYDEAQTLLAKIPETPQARRVAAMARNAAAGGASSAEDIEVKLTELLPKAKYDDEARQQFVDLLEVMGADDPRTAGWRRKLTNALF